MKHISTNSIEDAMEMAGQMIISYLDAVDPCHSNNQDPLDFDHLSYAIVVPWDISAGSSMKGYRFGSRVKEGWVTTSTILDYEYSQNVTDDPAFLQFDYIARTFNSIIGVKVDRSKEFEEKWDSVFK